MTLDLEDRQQAFFTLLLDFYPRNKTVYLMMNVHMPVRYTYIVERYINIAQQLLIFLPIKMPLGVFRIDALTAAILIR